MRGPGHRLVRAAAIGLSLGLVPACGTDGSDHGGEQAPVAIEAFMSEDDFRGRLAAAGIGVYDGAEPLVPVVEPASPVRLTDEQASNGYLSAISHAGYTGAELDRFVVAPPIGPGAEPVPASAMVAAWAQNAPSPAADLARDLLRDEPLTAPASVVFPLTVVTLFVADVVPRVDAAPAAGAHRGLVGARGRSAPVPTGPSVCEQFLGFVNGTIRSVFEAIGRLPNIGYEHDAWDWVRWFANVGIDLVNMGLDGVQAVLVDGVRVVLGPLINAIATVATVLAVVGEIAHAALPWSGVVVPDPLVNHRDAGTHPGTFELEVRTPAGIPDEWPIQIRGCARTAGVDLPPLRPLGNHVSWDITYQHPEPLVVRTGDSGPLSPESRATLAYTTIQESQEVAAGVLQHDGSVAVAALIRRDDLDPLITRVWNLLASQIQDDVRTLLAPVLAGIESELRRAVRRLESIRNVTSRTVLAMTYHVRDDTTTSSSTSTSSTTTTTTRPAPPVPDDVCVFVPAAAVEAVVGVPVVPWASTVDVPGLCDWSLDANGGPAGVLVRIVTGDGLEHTRRLMSAGALQPIAGFPWPAHAGMGTGPGTVVTASVFVDLGTWGLSIEESSYAAEDAFVVQSAHPIAIAASALGD